MPTQMNPTKYLKGSCQHCDGHVEFPAEMAGLTTTCPHCGQSTELLLAAPPAEPSVSRKALLWTSAAILILGLGLAGALVALKRAERLVGQQRHRAEVVAGAASSTNSSTTPAPENQPVEQSDLVVSDIILQKTTGSSLVYAVGTLRNSSKQKRFGVKVELALLDAAGQKVGSTSDYRQLLEPAAQWRFKALVVDSKAVSVKLESIKEDQ